MCGRYTLTANLEEVAAEFRVSTGTLTHQPRYNIAPTQDVLVIVEENGTPQLVSLRWGLVPHWAKAINSRYSMINARAETVAEKPSYRRSFEKRRCLIVADGFYEWKKVDGQKIPLYIRLTSGRPFGLAGLWDVWTPPEGGEPLRSCTIITTAPNELLASIHNRMPVILPRPAIDLWLDTTAPDKGALLALLKPYSADEMEAYPVSHYVNSPMNDSPKCIEPVS